MWLKFIVGAFAVLGSNDLFVSLVSPPSHPNGIVFCFLFVYVSSLLYTFSVTFKMFHMITNGPQMTAQLSVREQLSEELHAVAAPGRNGPGD